MGSIYDSALFRNLYCNLAEYNEGRCAGGGWFGDGLLPAGFEWLAFAIAGLLVIAGLVQGILTVVLVLIWSERRLLGRFQGRTGPNRWGPYGLFTPLADAVKTLFKEDVVPKSADRLLFNMAPIMMVAPALLVFAVIPLGAGTFLTDLNVGLLFIVAVGGGNVLAILTAGWASGNRYSMFSAVRSVAMLISYEIPMVISLVGVLMLAGSLSLVAIVDAQRVPFAIVQPLGFFVFVVAAVAEVNRTPFDVAEAESELVAGYLTEYSSMKFGLFYLAEFIATIASAAVITVLFLGGWRGIDPVPSQVWFLLKVVGVLFVIIWWRATWPRLRIDQIMAFAWKALFELTLINLVASGILVLIWPEPTTDQLWIMAGVNWVVFIASVLIFGWVLAPKHDRRAAGNIPPAVTLAGPDSSPGSSRGGGA